MSNVSDPIKRISSNNFTEYVNQNNKFQERIGVSKDSKVYKNWLGMK